jgi:hypothetical protein
MRMNCIGRLAEKFKDVSIDPAGMIAHRDGCHLQGRSCALEEGQRGR